ncbi:MAG TPA: pirin family protein [Candidatus Kapabacteria bacterium]|nr:pirin family protein [Candidatus Kapabacteria bacterium]
MNDTIFHKAASRGLAEHGWLKSYHTFSFANYYNPERMNFGALRVLNDDTVAAGRGFDMHHHSNMEIISIPLEGDLEHSDSMGNKSVIKSGDIQVMSAGTGVYHSEYNKNQDKLVKFLQIWVIPNKMNVTPRYDQITIKNIDKKNNFLEIVSPNKESSGVWIHQDAYFYLSDFDENFEAVYELKSQKNGVYVFNLNGSITIQQTTLESRDGIAIIDNKHINIKAKQQSSFLIMEVPLNV